MMKRVDKHEIPIVSCQKFKILLPFDWKMLTAGIHNEKPCMWVESFPERAKQVYEFACYGTGQDIPDSAVFMHSFWFGPLVLHLYRL